MSPMEYKIVFKVRLAADLLRGSVPPCTRRTNRAAVRYTPSAVTRAAKETALDLLEPYGVDLEHDDDADIRVLVERLDSYCDQSLYRLLIHRLVNPQQWPFLMMTPPEQGSPTQQRGYALEVSTGRIVRRTSSREVQRSIQQRQALGIPTPAQQRAEAGRLIDAALGMGDPDGEEAPDEVEPREAAQLRQVRAVDPRWLLPGMGGNPPIEEKIEPQNKQRKNKSRLTAGEAADKKPKPTPKPTARRLIIKKKRPPVISDE